jgi:hypothetical protein
MVQKSKKRTKVGDERLEERREQFANYTEYNKTLRTWFVTFGVGGPILFATQQDLATHLRMSGTLGTVVALFLVGCGLQVFLAILNKTASWYVYSGTHVSENQKTCTMQTAEQITEMYWIDVIADVVTAIMFGIASAKVAISAVS